MKKMRIIILIALCFTIIFGAVGCGTQTGSSINTINKSSTNAALNTATNNPPTSAPTTTKPNIENKTIITVDEAQKAVEDFCKRPNIGAQASHFDKFDLEVNGIKYYYFDVIYGLLMGDKPKAEDNAIARVFVNSKDKSLHEVVEDSNKKLSVGKILSK